VNHLSIFEEELGKFATKPLEHKYRLYLLNLLACPTAKEVLRDVATETCSLQNTHTHDVPTIFRLMS